MPNTVTGEAYAKEYAGNDALSIPRGAVSKGDKVRLAWDHNYVTRSENGGESKYPERVITALEPPGGVTGTPTTGGSCRRPREERVDVVAT